MEQRDVTNRVLDALDPADRRRLAPHLQEQEIERGRILFEAGTSVTHIYFIHSGVVSLEVANSRGELVESATIGREGAVGVGGSLSGSVSFTRQVVELPGRASVLDRRSMLRATEESASLRHVLWSYSDCLMAQVLQIAACNALHTSEERLARGLLGLADRWSDDEIPITQEVLSRMLGVRRATVTLAARMMQAVGLISYRRGRLAITDRAGLEEISCECYKVISELQTRPIQPR